jgi:hypothetical protein
VPRTLAPGTISESVRALLRVGSTLVVLVVACELGARALPVDLRPSARGTAFPYLEKNLARLEAVLAADGGVDCLVMGSSAAASAIDPERMADVYASDRGGKRLRCYNASLPGLPASASATLGALLVDRYHPTLLVYGVIARDFAPVAAAEFGARLEESPWVQYQTGWPTLEGWLSEHAVAYRGFLTLRDRIDPTRRRAREAESRWPPMSPRGFLMQPTTQRPPRPRLLPAAVDELSGRGAGDLPALDELLTVRRRGAALLLVALPVEPVLLADYEGAKTSYDDFVRRLSSWAHARAVPFWDTHESSLVPASAWVDEVHMTPAGAEPFSVWLGHRLAEAVGTHEIGDPAP